jgi:uncharacterized protein YceK
MKLVALVLAVSLLSGCASTVICTQANYDSMVVENTRLLESKKALEGYRAGNAMPDEKFSRIQRGGLLGIRERSYNQELDQLIYRSNQFNNRCVKGKNGSI